MIEACMLHFGFLQVGFNGFFRGRGYRVIPSALYKGVSFVIQGRGDREYAIVRLGYEGFNGVVGGEGVPGPV